MLHTNISPSPPEYTIRLLFPNPLKIKHRRETHFGQRKVKCVTSAWKLLHPLHNCHTPFASATVTRSFSDGGCSNSLDPGVILECHCGHSAGVRNKPMVLRCWALGVVCYRSMALAMLTTTHISWTLPDIPQNTPDPQWKQGWEISIASFKKSKLFIFYNICILEAVL